jgi:ABC-type multidrug transport system fused ATPase/permease subunit
VAEAVKLAQLEGFAAGLPAGLDTLIGEHGLTVSGGEKQRIAIARALYRRPELLVFDEATSALDSQTEQALVAALTGLRGRITVLLVAHRIQTVQPCEKIFFLSGGTIAASGTWDELKQGSADFRAFADYSTRKFPPVTVQSFH